MRTILLMRSPIALVLAVAIVAALAASALGETLSAYDNVSTAEGWAWSQIRQGLPADFGEHCGAKLDPRKGDDLAWRDTSDCRTIPAALLVDILTRPLFRDALTYKGLDIRGAKIVGDVDLAFAKLDRPVRITDSRFEGAVSFTDARAETVIELSGSSVAGRLDASGLHSNSDLSLYRAVISKAGVSLDGATIAGFVDMTGATCVGDLSADSLQVGGSLSMRSHDKNQAIFQTVKLVGAKVSGNVELTGAQVVGELNADSLQVGGSLFMRSDDKNQANFQGVNLRSAKVTGNVEMDGAHIEGDLNAASSQVGGWLFMRSHDKNQAIFTTVTLAGAKVSGSVELTGAHVEGDLNADSLQVSGLLFMRSDDKNQASFHGVILRGANVTGNVDLIGAHVEGDLNADSLQDGGSLLMRSRGKNHASFQSVVLDYATVKGKLDMAGASFARVLDAQRLSVLGDLSLPYIAADKARFRMRFAQLGGNLDLAGAKLAGIDLRGASVAGEMRVGDRNAPAVVDLMDLRNAHVGFLSDNKESWHVPLLLDGFTFARLGGSEGDSSGKMLERGAKWWDRSWARLDTDFASSVYEQLAGAFSAAGDHDAADEMHFREQLRADDKATGVWAVWRWLFRWAAGYGIGSYMFRALYWALGLSLLGAAYLRYRFERAKADWGVGAKAEHGIFWCFGASVNQFLPLVTLKKEFKDFFDNQNENKFNKLENFAFTMLAALGWALGLIVLAAMATITHGS
jgi:uncharacterized protein YjbI with pentapeptide repeats